MIRSGQEMARRLVAVKILGQLMFFTLRYRRERCHLLTTDNRGVHLNVRPNGNVGKNACHIDIIVVTKNFDEIY